MGSRGILGGLVSFVVLAVTAASTQAGVVITSQSQDTPGLAGYKTVILTATSDVPGEFIAVVDFIGDNDNTNPATARGFFGPMNQLMAGPQTTVFNDFNFVFPEPLQDSQFRISSSAVLVPAGFAIESNSFLRATYAYGEPSAQSLQFVQLAIPSASTATINYRGAFSVTRGGTVVDLPEVTGMIITDHNLPPTISPIFRDVTLGVNHEVLTSLQLLAMDEFLPPEELVWSNLVVDGPGKNPNFPSASDPQLNSDGVFSWDPNGWRGGQYMFTATVADERNETMEVALTVNLTVPEPTSCVAVVGLCLGTLPAIRRRRRVLSKRGW